MIRVRRAATLLFTVAAAVLLAGGCGVTTASPESAGTATGMATSAVTGTVGASERAATPATSTGASALPQQPGTPTPQVLAPDRPTTALPTVTVAALPGEARATLQLINDGGPFPFSKDGTVFGNRESLLPQQKSGFYREYTVITPGSDDRGARRIVAGQDGSRFYTSDHYDSFREVVAR
ncbi:MAG: ribonuclease domain-containing protein [Candidatus Nanopelagicales bacterium]